MRLDKFLKVSRIIKRRTLAKEVGDAGRIELNGRAAKPGSEVKPGDILVLDFGRRKLKVEILEVRDSVRAEQAGQMYRVIEETSG
ncbi:MAG: RNA-binding S4 domain-containing protein [Actinobacteria bacterium]|nr:RNA-binding S4 domain-containing protein [Actinomycetota bacterium]